MARFLVTLIPKLKFGYVQYFPLIFFINDKVPDWMIILLLLAGSMAGDSLNQKDDDLITDFASPWHSWQSIKSNLKSSV
jgi:hypothetical protein